MSVKKKYFGTDGVRGRVGASLINPEFVLKLGWAVGKILANGSRPQVIIGKDTRVSGYLLESVLEAGLSAAGVDIKLLGPMPTAAIAYLTRTLGASAGIVISGSHNGHRDNGIKIFSAAGKKLPDEIELAIEEKVKRPLEMVSPARLGKASRVVDAPGRYIEFCKSTVSSTIRLGGFKIVIDCANGATYHIAPAVFRELGAEVIDIAVEPDGFNINAECGSTFPHLLQKTVLAKRADLGIAFDGDGDRLIMVDGKGEILNGDELLYIIAKDRLRRKQMQGGVVGTVMSNLGLEHALQNIGIKFVRSQVGDRHVLEALEQRGWQLGGEQSGHIICLDKATTGDGIISALQVLSALCNENKTLHELKADIVKLPQVKVDIELEHPKRVSEDACVKKAVKQIQAKMGQSGRVLLRPSGTEPVVRVMVEGKEFSQISTYAKQLAEIVKSVSK